MVSATGAIDLSESQQPRLYGAYSTTYLLAVTSICLRLVCRKYLSKAGLWWDDYAICFSLVRNGFLSLFPNSCVPMDIADISRRLSPLGTLWTCLYVWYLLLLSYCTKLSIARVVSRSGDPFSTVRTKGRRALLYKSFRV